ncbi:hypothetical protein ACCO45_000284 [Purpureocillium lilacinum]|uniref:Uncharacterized protein n=1 Tax=Purpureocillium lilacinum TaxID=33203 RepID=A0ACC4E3R9_PURLI
MVAAEAALVAHAPIPSENGASTQPATMEYSRGACYSSTTAVVRILSTVQATASLTSMVFQGEGHMSRDCPEPLKDNKSCYKCGQAGHISRDCPLPAAAVRPPSATRWEKEFDVETRNS